MKYQHGHPDCFYHRYAYDGDNRITQAYTSRNGYVWDRDANYMYYLHGPLMRTETGQHNVQGVDYAYTLQGWLKGVNSSSMLAHRDMGKDGHSGLYANFARDAFGYTIDYYNDSLNGIFDYKPIDNNATSFLAYRSNSDLSNTSRNLYNGNISYLTTAIPDIGELTAQNPSVKPWSMIRHFHYDKLNRITQQQTANLSISDNKWDDKILDFSTDYSYDYNGNLLSLNRKENEINNEVKTMDSLAYTYYTSGSGYYSGQLSNRLQQVTDNAGATTYDLDFEGTSSYTYDAIGNLISDSGDSIASIEWNTYGKVRKVTRTAQCEKPDLEFWYDPMGNRICKIVKPRPNGNATNQSHWTFTWYMRDAQGNIMATYNETHDALSAALRVQEFPMYGSSRLGIYNTADTLSEIAYGSGTFDADSFYTAAADPVQIPAPDTTRYHYIPLHKQYELTNHLGNVLVTLSAKPILVDSTQNNMVDYKMADVMSVADYYPFGMMMPSRHWSSGEYRFGFNAQEKDNEIYGLGNSYSAEFWQYDARLGIRWNLDPKPNPSISSYATFANNPILYIDLFGDTIRNKNIENVEIARNNLMNAEENLEIALSLNDNYSQTKITSSLNNLLIDENVRQVKTAERELEKQIDLYNNTEAVINEFRDVNPDLYDYWHNNPYIIDVESQSDKIKMYYQGTGQQRLSTTNERVSIGRHRAKIDLAKTNYQDMNKLIKLTFSFVHALGHIDDFLKGNLSEKESIKEDSANRYATEHYFKKK